jgi:C-terminal processing protease CtpA/Prc
VRVSEGFLPTTNSSAEVATEEASKIFLQDRITEAFSAQEPKVLTFELKEHSPLGCTVEESLNKEDGFVFISKIAPGGHADKSGLRVGDVIAGVTGLFGEVTPVLDSGVEKM